MNHVFHADADLSVTVESSVEADNVRRVALMEHHQLTNDLVANCRLDLQVYQLQQQRNALCHAQYNVYARSSAIAGGDTMRVPVEI